MTAEFRKAMPIIWRLAECLGHQIMAISHCLMYKLRTIPSMRIDVLLRITAQARQHFKHLNMYRYP
ncbi:hypothetical protein C4Q26_15610 [Pseudomonas sp. SWI44]|nr:hypothetical protein C4Q26_15610 [Pseudomonas sp. SWI44]